MPSLHLVLSACPTEAFVCDHSAVVVTQDTLPTKKKGNKKRDEGNRSANGGIIVYESVKSCGYLQVKQRINL